MGRKEKIAFMVILAILMALWLLFLPGCPWRNLTGFPCPGCGMSRAWWSALRLDFAAAWEQHPMFWSVPVWLWLFWRDFRPFRRSWLNRTLTLGLVAGLLVCYGCRMYLGRIS